MTPLNVSPAALDAAHDALAAELPALEAIRNDPTHPERYAIAGRHAGAKYRRDAFVRLAALPEAERLDIERLDALVAVATAEEALAEFERDIGHVACQADAALVREALDAAFDDARAALRALNAAEAAR